MSEEKAAIEELLQKQCEELQQTRARVLQLDQECKAGTASLNTTREENSSLSSKSVSRNLLALMYCSCRLDYERNDRVSLECRLSEQATRLRSLESELEHRQSECTHLKVNLEVSEKDLEEHRQTSRDAQQTLLSLQQSAKVSVVTLLCVIVS